MTNQPAAADRITVPVALEIAGHEGLVQEAYRDGGGVWTWGIGVTSASGHRVERYKDNPQPIARCIEVYIWLLRTKYGPEVVAAFAGHELTEAQFAAALSFHFNTGAIGRTDWVKLFLAGRAAEARVFLEDHYLNGGDLTSRRKAEAALFFNGVWSQDGCTTLFGVRKPSYTPDWGSAKRIDITAEVRAAIEATA